MNFLLAQFKIYSVEKYLDPKFDHGSGSQYATNPDLNGSELTTLAVQVHFSNLYQGKARQGKLSTVPPSPFQQDGRT
jgi:hypothetical protein